MNDVDEDAGGRQPGHPGPESALRSLTWCGLAATAAAVMLGLSRFSYPLFHSVMEIFVVAVAWGVYLLVWNARRFMANDAVMALGVGSLFVGVLEMLHTFAGSGMNLSPASDVANVTTQFWVATRAMAACSVLIFALLLGRRAALGRIWAFYAIASAAACVSILIWPVFPDCSVGGRGPTPFMMASEYAICAVFAAALVLLIRRRRILPPLLFGVLGASIVLSVGVELCFTSYAGTPGMAVAVGHLLHAASYLLLYSAIIRMGLTEPYGVLFRRWEAQRNELEHVEERNRRLFETMEQGVVFQDARGRITAANPAAQRILGRSLEELQGRTSTDAGWKAVREDASEFPGEEHPSMVALRTGRRVQGVIMGVERPDGDCRWILVDAVPECAPGRQDPPGVLTTFSDITDRKRAEDRLRDILLFSRETERIGRIGGWRTNARSDSLTWTDGVREIIEVPAGYQPDLTEGLKFYSPEFVEPLRTALLRTLEDGTPFAIEAEVITATGRRLWAEVRGLRKIEDGGEPAVVGTILDITERKKADAALRSHADFTQRVFDSTDAHLAVVGRDGRILQVNAAWRRFALENGAGPESAWGVGASYFRDVAPASKDAAIAREVAEGLKSVQEERRPLFVSEYACHPPDGDRWFALRVVPVSGRPGTVLVSHTDISTRKRAELALQRINEELERRVGERTADLEREVEERRQAELVLREAQRLGRLGHWADDLRTGRAVWSEELYRILDLDPAHTRPGREAAMARVHPEDRTRVEAAMDDARRHHAPMESTHRLVLGDGTVRHVRLRQVTEFDAAGAPARVLGTAQDVTAAVEAEHALREANARMEAILNSSDSFAYVCDLGTHEVLFANETARALCGDMVGRKCWATIQAGQSGPCPFCTNDRLFLPDGTPAGLLVWEHWNERLGKWFECRDRAIRWSDGRLVRLEIATDITERKRIEEELRLARRELEQRVEQRTSELQDSEATFRALFNTMVQGVIYCDAAGRITAVNPAAEQLLGHPAREILGSMVTDDRWPAAHDNGAPMAEHERPILRALRTGQVVRGVSMLIGRPGDPNMRCVLVDAVPDAIPAPDGTCRGAFATFVDVTEHRGMARVIERQAEQYRAIINATQDGVIVMAFSGRPLEVNDTYCRMVGYSREELLGMSVNDIAVGEGPEDTLRRLERIRAMGWDRFETRHRTRDGRILSLEVTASMVRDAGSFVCFLHDVTGRRELEAKFLQAQKMEAVGQLAGGVAHDFNNILLAMFLQIELLQDTAGSEGETAEGLRDLKASARKAANLTRQLLIFSRRHAMERKNLDLGVLVEGLAKMLGRVMGETIALDLDIERGACRVEADAGMLEQVVMNLCINARDAMPSGGRLTLSVKAVDLDREELRRHPEAKPGRWVCLTVRDTGTGMDGPTLARVFEPFFTTKGIGHGTGLGLPTALGIVQQHGGWMDVDSEPGRGATFRVLLPMHAAEYPGRPEMPAVDAEGQPDGGSEIILLVEDDPAARQMTAAVLRRRGYHLLEAETGSRAIHLWTETGGHIDLLLTDMVMPEGMSGAEVADRLRELKPSLKVIFSSGHTAEYLDRTVGTMRGTRLLAKPYSMTDLCRVVRECLDGTALDPT